MNKNIKFFRETSLPQATTADSLYFISNGLNEFSLYVTNSSNQVYSLFNNSGGITDTFETLSKNLKSLDYAFAYVQDDIDTITYDLGNGDSIIKQFLYAGDNVVRITLSGTILPGINLNKNLAYDVNDNIINITYN